MRKSMLSVVLAMISLSLSAFDLQQIAKVKAEKVFDVLRLEGEEPLYPAATWLNASRIVISTGEDFYYLDLGMKQVRPYPLPNQLVSGDIENVSIFRVLNDEESRGLVVERYYFKTQTRDYSLLEPNRLTPIGYSPYRGIDFARRDDSIKPPFVFWRVGLFRGFLGGGETQTWARDSVRLPYIIINTWRPGDTTSQPIVDGDSVVLNDIYQGSGSMALTPALDRVAFIGINPKEDSVYLYVYLVHYQATLSPDGKAYGDPAKPETAFVPKSLEGTTGQAQFLPTVVDHKRDFWYQVVFSSGEKGWVHGKDLALEGMSWSERDAIWPRGYMEKLKN